MLTASPKVYLYVLLLLAASRLHYSAAQLMQQSWARYSPFSRKFPHSAFRHRLSKISEINQTQVNSSNLTSSNPRKSLSSGSPQVLLVPQSIPQGFPRCLALEAANSTLLKSLRPLVQGEFSKSHPKRLKGKIKGNLVKNKVESSSLNQSN